MVTRYLCLLLLLALSASAQTPRIPPPESVNRNGLVGRWLVPGYQTGNGPSPTKVNDASGKGNHGTTVASPNYGMIYSRMAMTLNGSSQYVSVPNATALQIPLASSFSIVLWAKTASADRQDIYKKSVDSDPSNGIFGFTFNGVTAHKVTFVLRGDNRAGLSYITSTKTVNDGVWHHIVGVKDKAAGNLLIYVDGVSSATPVTDNTTSAMTTGSFSIGRSGDDNLYYFNGSIFDVRLYSRALAPAEIALIYRGIQ
jgi:hypothetical protein